MAYHVEEVSKYWDSERKGLFLETADINQSAYLSRIPIPDSIDLERTLNKQLLVNGDFSIDGPARYKLPSHWTTKFTHTSGIVEKYTGDSVSAGGSLRLHADTGQLAHIAQVVNLALPKSSKVTASIWYKNKIHTNYNGKESDSNAELRLSYVKRNGTVKTSTKKLESATAMKWRRDWITVELDDDAQRFEYSVELTPTGTIPKEYFVDGAMLEIGDRPTQFERSAFDVPEHVKGEGLFYASPVAVEAWSPPTEVVGDTLSNYPSTGNEIDKIHITPIADRNLFFDNGLVPTRLSVSSYTADHVSLSNKFFGIWSNDIEQSSERAWDVVGTSGFRDMLFSYTWPNKIDNDKSYLIADPGVTQETLVAHSVASVFDLFDQYTVSSRDLSTTGSDYELNIENFTIKYEKIWAVCKERYSGNTARILKVINPRTEYKNSYLETIADLTIADGTGAIHGGVSSVGFSSTDADTLIIGLTGASMSISGHTVKMHKDYCYIDDQTRHIFTKESYTGQGRSVVII